MDDDCLHDEHINRVRDTIRSAARGTEAVTEEEASGVVLGALPS